MELKIKTFDELTLRELYEILRLRSEVFIVEQEGHYQDLDQVDYDSVHIFLEEAGEIAGCLRVYTEEDDAPGRVHIGRVVSRSRMHGLGRQMMEAAERVAKTRYHASELYLTGRKSARGFYLRCGFREDPTDLPYCILRKII